MSSLAGQFARKVALFVKDEKLNSSEFQLKSTDGDKIVMTDGDDLEFTVTVLDRNGKFSVSSDYVMLQGKWLRKLNEFCNAGRKDITDVLKLASSEYMDIIMDDDDEEEVDEEDADEQKDENEDKDDDVDDDDADEEDEEIVMEEEDDDNAHKKFKVELDRWLESFKWRKENEKKAISRDQKKLSKQTGAAISNRPKLEVEVLAFNNNYQVTMLLNKSIFSIHYPKMFNPTKGEHLLVSSEDLTLADFVTRVNNYMKKHSSSLGSLGIALSILLTKALEYYIELTYIEPLTPFSKHQVKDDVFGTTVEEEGADSDDEVQEKQPQELYKKAWGQATPFVGPYNEEARQHVLKEVASIMKRQAQYIREGFEIELVDENPFVWNVRLFNFPEDSDLANDLEQYHQRYELGEKDIVVEIKFTGAFPSEPPAVRVVKPRLQYLTGQVTFDGFLCVDFLLPQKWNRHAHMDTIIQQIKNSLIENKARVDLRTHFEYDTKQASEAYVRQQQFRSFRVPTANNFTQNMFVFSTEFSKSIVQSSKLQQIDRGNKVILSPAVAEKIFSSQEFQLPLIFEIKSLRGQRVYCGVSEFTAPDGNIIVPQFMMKDLFLTEGTKVQVRSVVLPMATRLKIQPHSKQFYEIQDHKSVLEKALFNFSCLTEGQTIPITDSNTNKTYLIEVVETLPDRAVSIMTDHGYLDVEIDFIPAVDLVDKNTLKERQDEERRIKRETRDQRIHKCIQHTLRKRVQKKQHVETALSRAKQMNIKETAEIRIKFPNGKQAQINLDPQAPTRTLYEYVETLEDEELYVCKPYTTPECLELTMQYPKMLIPNSFLDTLETAGCFPRGMLLLQEHDRFGNE